MTFVVLRPGVVDPLRKGVHTRIDGHQGASPFALGVVLPTLGHGPPIGSSDISILRYIAVLRCAHHTGRATPLARDVVAFFLLCPSLAPPLDEHEDDAGGENDDEGDNANGDAYSSSSAQSLLRTRGDAGAIGRVGGGGRDDGNSPNGSVCRDRRDGGC